MPCERSSQISDGHRTDHLFSEERQIVSGRLSVRNVTPFHTSTDWHRHNQYRSSHARRHALARDPLSTEILHGIHFRFVRATAAVRPQYSLVPKTQLYCGIITLQRCKHLQASCAVTSCLFALYMNEGYTPQQFVRLFTPSIANRQVVQIFTRNFGTLCGTPRGGQCCLPTHK